MTEIERALRSISERIKGTAFRMPPPNDYTPEFVMHASALDQLRAIVAKEQRRVADLERALLAVVNATRLYLPPDGIEAKDCISMILEAVDNPTISPIILDMETKALGHGGEGA